MQTFKVGDRVRCTDPNHQIEGGQEGVITWANHELLEIDASKWRFFHHRFVKVNTFKGNIK